LRAYIGSFAKAFRFGCLYSAPGTSRASLIADSKGDPHPQAEMFLRRDLSPAVAIERVFRARAALRDGLAIYLNGDIPWVGPNTCAGLMLGRTQRFLAIWTELAVLTGAPVFLVFCTHLPGGRFALEIEAIGHLRPGEEDTAVADYLKQLEARIATSPADAVAHLSWPCYQLPPSPPPQHRKRRAKTGWQQVVRSRN